MISFEEERGGDQGESLKLCTRAFVRCPVTSLYLIILKPNQNRTDHEPVAKAACMAHWALSQPSFAPAQLVYPHGSENSPRGRRKDNFSSLFSEGSSRG